MLADLAPPVSSLPVTIVSGLPRSGTSLLMQMLAAGGMPLLIDDARAPDDDNPGGYFELERVKRLATDAAWVDLARGKAIKVISALLRQLPSHLDYRIIFMERPLTEVLASQSVMLRRRGIPADQDLMPSFQRHLHDLKLWIGTQPNLQVLYFAYHDVLHDPPVASRRLHHFIDRPLDAAAMAAVVEPRLYRQRA